MFKQLTRPNFNYWVLRELVHYELQTDDKRVRVSRYEVEIQKRPFTMHLWFYLIHWLCNKLPKINLPNGVLLSTWWHTNVCYPVERWVVRRSELYVVPVTTEQFNVFEKALGWDV